MCEAHPVPPLTHHNLSYTRDGIRYWDEINAFARDAGVKIIFGLNPSSATNAIELIQYTAKKHPKTIFAYSYGNEQVGDKPSG